MTKSLNVGRWSMPLLTGLLTSAAGSVYAQGTPVNASEDYTIVNTLLGQGNAAVNGGQAVQNNSCVPTAVANGLSYLDAYQGNLGNSTFFTVSPNTYTAVNALGTAMGTTAAGTSAAAALSGLQTYLGASDANPAPNLSVSQVADPSAQALANVLTAHDGVQLGILWGVVNGSTFVGGGSLNGLEGNTGGGGHFVSLDAINLTGGTGTIGIVDPWGNGGANAAASGTQDTLEARTVTITSGITPGTYLEVAYQVADVPNDDNHPGGTDFGLPQALTGLIALDEIEAVPEPGSMLISALTMAGVSGFLLIRRQK